MTCAFAPCATVLPHCVFGFGMCVQERFPHVPSDRDLSLREEALTVVGTPKTRKAKTR